MWRLWNLLFGWHYVAVKFGSSIHICFVDKLPGGRVVVWIYGEVYDLDDTTGLARGATTGWLQRFTPLTFAPHSSVKPAAEPKIVPPMTRAR